jgi:hypothetical protein
MLISDFAKFRVAEDIVPVPEMSSVRMLAATSSLGLYSSVSGR